MQFSKLFPTSFLSLIAIAATSFAGGSEWLTDLEVAKEKAKAENKTVLVDFTGSDWCSWCIKLDREVFSKNEFQEYAADELVLVEIDFPKRKSLSDEQMNKNKALMKKYGIRGFPTILLIASNGEIVGKTGYQRGGASKYVEHIESFLK